MINRGVSLGLQASSWLGWVALLVVGLLLVRERHKGLWLVLIGGLANMGSRWVHGGVVDDWQLAGVLYNNWADYLIVIGIVWYTIQTIGKLRGPESRKAREPEKT